MNQKISNFASGALTIAFDTLVAAVNNVSTTPITVKLSLQNIYDFFGIGDLENAANKSTSVTTDQASDAKYPSVKSVFDWVTAGFQEILVSGTNIKTLNGVSLLGGGNIVAGNTPYLNYGTSLNQVLLLNFESTPIIDSSPNALTVTNSGVTVSTAQFFSGVSSGLFNGSAKLSITSALFAAACEFYVKIRLRPTVINPGYNLYIDTRNSGLDTAPGFTAGFNGGGLLVYKGGVVIQNVGTMTLNAWNTVDIVVLNGYLMLFKDGVFLAGAALISPSSTVMTYGMAVDNSNGYTGYIDVADIKTRAVTVN